MIKEGDCEHLIPYRSYRNGALTQEQQYKNRLPSRMGVRVEPVFARMSPYGLDGLRRIGLKASEPTHWTEQLNLSFGTLCFLAREWIETRVRLV